MRPALINDTLTTAHKAGLSVMLLGSPGTAKTELVRQYADTAGYPLIHVYAPLTDLLDLKGVISTDGEQAKFLPVNIWPKRTDDPVVVLIDELPQCVPAIQNAFSQLLIDHKLGDLHLPEGSLVVATGNKKEDRAATHNMPSHVTNRVMHIYVDRNNEDFFNWGMHNGIDPMIIAFGHYKPDAMYTFDPKNGTEPYASYRSWEFVSNILKTDPSKETLLELLRGVIGEAAYEFVSFGSMYRHLQDPKDLLDDPSIFNVPTEPSTQYATSIGLASAVTKATVGAFFQLINQLPAEFSVLSLRTAKTTTPEVMKGKAFTTWAKANNTLVLE